MIQISFCFNMGNNKINEMSIYNVHNLNHEFYTILSKFISFSGQSLIFVYYCKYGLIVFQVLIEKFVLVAPRRNSFKNLDASTT